MHIIYTLLDITFTYLWPGTGFLLDPGRAMLVMIHCSHNCTSFQTPRQTVSHPFRFKHGVISSAACVALASSVSMLTLCIKMTVIFTSSLHELLLPANYLVEIQSLRIQPQAHLAIQTKCCTLSELLPLFFHRSESKNIKTREVLGTADNQNRAPDLPSCGANQNPSLCQRSASVPKVLQVVLHILVVLSSCSTSKVVSVSIS